MLGRQQIAGIPTAIHELFKNAHDAYAQRVEADYFRSERLLVLRDDGLGMTSKDVNDKWLTLGTESRLGANDLSTEVWTGPDKLPRRIVMGEKGIGRLAVAAIGPVTLLFSKAIRQDGPRATISVLVHWSLFEQPAIDVSSIVVPIRESTEGIPPKSVLVDMIEELDAAIDNLAKKLTPSEAKRLRTELDGLRSVDPQHLERYLNQGRATPLSLTGAGFGTWFVITPTAPELDDDIDSYPDTMGTSNFNKVLLGFANTMDETYQPVIQTDFRDHWVDGTKSLIGPKQFFDRTDFEQMDHLLEGTFDERGQFVGRISFYGESERDFILNWTAGRGRLARCGPFRIKVGALQGRASESRLDRATHASMLARLNELGGLYIYRDGIRVLPYGTAQNDFLGIELRRTLAAKDWYFSYRRMIGFIALTHEANASLSEKAGREGFRENYAFRDLKSVLGEFFRSVAIRFFRSTSDEGSDYQELKEQYVREREALERRSKRVRERRKEFQSRLAEFRRAVDDDYFLRRTDMLLQRHLPLVDRVKSIRDSKHTSELLTKISGDLRSDIAELRSEIAISPPRGLALTKQLERDWLTYRKLYPELIEQTVGRLETEALAEVDHLARSTKSKDRLRVDAIEALETRKTELYKEVAAGQRETWRVAESMHKALKRVLRSDLGELRNQFESIMSEYSRATTDDTTDIEQHWQEVEQKMRSLRDLELELVHAVRRQLNEFRETIIQRTTVDDEVAALEQRVERLSEQLEFQSELAQIGMAVGILGHEFHHTVGEFRNAIHDLKDWADGTDGMRPLYRRLRSSFESLEGYLQMLTPLGRRLTRHKVDISGSEIELYIRRIFSERLNDQAISLTSTSEFSSHIVKCRTSNILSAFVNVIDNALYWLAHGSLDHGEITLDADDNGFLIGNNGPGISELDAEQIFEFGWTTKPGGAGMGLALASDALASEGFRLELREFGPSRDPVFAITTRIEEEDS